MFDPSNDDSLIISSSEISVKSFKYLIRIFLLNLIKSKPFLHILDKNNKRNLI